MKQKTFRPPTLYRIEIFNEHLNIVTNKSGSRQEVLGIARDETAAGNKCSIWGLVYECRP